MNPKHILLGCALLGGLLFTTLHVSPPARADGIGGTGITGLGRIEGFGSIFVNGREYFLDERTEVSVDGKRATEQALQLGDVVIVQAALNPQTGVAQSLLVQNEAQLRGRIDAVDREKNELLVLGQRVRFDAASLLMAGQEPIQLGQLQPGDSVRVNGLATANAAWMATRVTRLDATDTDADSFTLRGALENITHGKPRTIKLGGQTLHLPEDLTMEALKIGAEAVVHGRYEASRLRARTVRAERVLLPGKPDDIIEMEGYIQARPGGHMSNGIQLHFAPELLTPNAADAWVANERVVIRGSLKSDHSLYISEPPRRAEHRPAPQAIGSVKKSSPDTKSPPSPRPKAPRPSEPARPESHSGKIDRERTRSEKMDLPRLDTPQHRPERPEKIRIRER